MNRSDLGFAALRTMNRPGAPSAAHALSLWPGAGGRGLSSRQGLVGWTPPTIIYDDMRAIKVDADRLDALVKQHVTDAVFRSAWDAWFANWNTFFTKYQSDLNKLGAVFYTDDLAQRVKTYGQELINFSADYNRQRGRDGGPVPQVSAPPMRDPRAPGREKEDDGGGGWRLPWWFWMLGGVAVVGLGYYGYRQYQEAQHAKRVLTRDVLPGLIGPRLARAAERDPERDESLQHPAPGQTRRDENTPLPMLHARNPQEVAAGMGLFYRPYDHPHLVATRPGIGLQAAGYGPARRDETTTEYDEDDEDDEAW